ncbi:MAG: UvrD-helicase domain-containing protein [Candidatus Binatia bacterium]
MRDVWTTRLYDAPPPVLDGLAALDITPATVTTIAGAFALQRAARAGQRGAGRRRRAGVGERLRARASARTCWPRWRAARQRQPRDFDDLLHQLANALESDSAALLAAGIRRRYGLALIDEFQDTDPIQFRIFHAVQRRTAMPLFLIGDPKQAIYAFRGADVFAYSAGAARGRGAAHAAHQLALGAAPGGGGSMPCSARPPMPSSSPTSGSTTASRRRAIATRSAAPPRRSRRCASPSPGAPTTASRRRSG